jgi:hypothetical protein
MSVYLCWVATEKAVEKIVAEYVGWIVLEK